MAHAYPVILNQPPVISRNGVLAIGSAEANQLLSTTGSMPSQVVGRGPNVGNPSDLNVSGTASELQLKLDSDGGEEQRISIWTPNAELTGFDGLSVTFPEAPATSVTVDPSADPGTSLLQKPAALSADLEPVLETRIPCGTTDAVTGTRTDWYLNRQYRAFPVEEIEEALVDTTRPATMGDRFFRAFRVGIDRGVPFQPWSGTGTLRGLQTSIAFMQQSRVRFPPQARYCVQVEALTLASGSILTSQMCVDDDGRDWTAKVPAKPDQIDFDLMYCSDPPASLVARHCALWRDVPGGTALDCSAYSPADLDAALATPVDLDALGTTPIVDGGVAEATESGTAGAPPTSAPSHPNDSQSSAGCAVSASRAPFGSSAWLALVSLVFAWSRRCAAAERCERRRAPTSRRGEGAAPAERKERGKQRFGFEH